MDIAHNKFLQTFRRFCDIKGRSRGLAVEREGEALWKSHKNDLDSAAEQMRTWEESIAEIKKKSCILNFFQKPSQKGKKI
jgi:hypothetical protein